MSGPSRPFYFAIFQRNYLAPKLPSYGQKSYPITCQPPRQQERAKSRVKPHYRLESYVVWVLGSRSIGSVFPQLRASIWESCRKKVPETVAGSSMCISECSKARAFEAVWKIRLPKSARDYWEGSICMSSVFKIKRWEHFWKSGQLTHICWI
jgi:hypothetical protein